MPRSVADDHEVVVVRGGQALAAQAQAGGAHALQLGVGAQRGADEGVLQGKRNERSAPSTNLKIDILSCQAAEWDMHSSTTTNLRKRHN